MPPLGQSGLFECRNQCFIFLSLLFSQVGEVTQDTKASFASAAKLLGTEPDELLTTIRKQNMHVGGSTIVKIQSKAQVSVSTSPPPQLPAIIRLSSQPTSLIHIYGMSLLLLKMLLVCLILNSLRVALCCQTPVCLLLVIISIDWLTQLPRPLPRSLRL